MTGLVQYDRQGHVAVITYNRPRALNAINRRMRAELNDAWTRFRDDEDAWVAIVTGAGRAFCAGADLADPAGAAGTWPGSFWEIPTVNSFESGMEIWKPTIAAVNGHCLGYGLTLVCACDFVIASQEAVFGFPEVTLGLPTIVGAIRLPGKIGWQRAMELLLTGEQIGADRARELGLAGWVVPPADLLAEAHRLAGRLLAAAPLAARATKEMAWRAPRLPWTEAVRMGEAMRRLAADSTDAREAAAARREGRPPQWTGR
jgi:E-phenylitaconyl-CoA hydratase